MQENLKINDIINIDIKRLGINGEGIGFHNRLAIFIDGAIPGEKVLAKITKVYHNRANAAIEDVLFESKYRIEPICPLYDLCGGCQLQHIDYQRSLLLKRDILTKAFNRYLKTNNTPYIKNTIGSTNVLNYRYEANLPIFLNNNNLFFGLNSIKDSNLIEINECRVHHQNINKIYNTIKNIINSNSFIADFKNSLLSTTIKQSEKFDETMVVFNLNKDIDLNVLIKVLKKEHPYIKSIYKYIDNNYILVYGKEYISEKFLDVIYNYYPDHYFHPNPKDANNYYKHIINKMNFINNKNITVISSNNKIVYEIIKDKVHNVNYFNFKNNLELDNGIDLLFLVPNKKGLNFELINKIILRKPKNIIYASSNPSTLAKDLARLNNIYEINEIVPFDLFPFTSLIDSVAILNLK